MDAGMMDQQTEEEEELVYCVQGIGSVAEDGLFLTGERVLESLKGLNILIKRDNKEMQPVHYKLGQWDVVRTHLVPLFVSYRDDQNVVFQVSVQVYNEAPIQR